MDPDPASPRGLSAPSVSAEDQQDLAVDLDRWRALAARVLIAERVPARAELSVTFVDETEITLLNEQYMGEAGPTDVLSFPIDGAELASGELLPDEPILLGDVVICPSVALRNAPNHPGTHASFHRGEVDDEIALLVVHGVLHLLGYDHQEPADEAVMRRRELELLTAYYGVAP